MSGATSCASAMRISSGARRRLADPLGKAVAPIVQHEKRYPFRPSAHSLFERRSGTAGPEGTTVRKTCGDHDGVVAASRPRKGTSALRQFRHAYRSHRVKRSAKQLLTCCFVRTHQYCEGNRFSGQRSVLPRRNHERVRGRQRVSPRACDTQRPSHDTCPRSAYDCF